MLVRIDVIERKAGRMVGLELRLDLRRELPPGRGTREYVKREMDHVAAEPPGRVDEIGHALRRQDRLAFHQHQMQADAQLRHQARAGDRVRGRGGANHEACGRQDAALMRGFDRLVDFTC